MHGIYDESLAPLTPSTAPRKQATFSDESVVVTFGKNAVNRREPNDEPSEDSFHIVYINGWDAGEAYPKMDESGVEIYLTQSAQPNAFKVLHSAERFFQTKNIKISYTD